MHKAAPSASSCCSGVCMQILTPSADPVTLHLDIKHDVYYRAKHPASRYNLFRVISCKDVDKKPLDLPLLSRWYSDAKCAAARLASLLQDPILVATDATGTVVQDNEQFLPSQHSTAAGQLVNSSTHQDPATMVSFTIHSSVWQQHIHILCDNGVFPLSLTCSILTCRVKTALLYLHRLMVIL